MTPRSPGIALVDFGMGNLRSVARALERVGAEPRVTQDPAEVLHADRLVVPGVGALADSMRFITRLGLAEALRERIRAGRPYLGLCLGLQILLEEGEEGPSPGLGLIPGCVARFRPMPGLCIPHMGWNRVRPVRPHAVIRDGYFYFVHAYRPSKVPEAMVLGTTTHGTEFPSVVGFDACLAVQFHPEKSQQTGLGLLERFCSWSP